ncbi:uncharacterized protein LOC116340324 [Contarinia nasturtii]|uniref:uncharacterized protein LOC116340324 n=1 Tax=Contarinia nasturtii TaxID=265458 RepID=UPI0012D4B235|nr:uncharacterized protein LOC116340324 [Contarinia nasturtii]
MVNGKMMQRKKKGRLYSLGGNEPPKRAARGRLDRLKTVGTFDLGNEMVLNEVAQHLNEHINCDAIDENGATPERIQARRMSANALLASGAVGLGTTTESPIPFSAEHRLSYTPGPCRREIQKGGLAKRMASRDSKHPSGSATPSPSTRRLHTATPNNQPNVPTQHSADDCFEKTKPFIDHRKSRSSSTSTILCRVDGDPKYFQSGAVYKSKSPIKHLPATNFIKKSDYKTRPMTKNVESNIDKTPTQSVDIESTSTTATVMRKDDNGIVHETETVEMKESGQEKNENFLEKGESVETAASDKTQTSADDSITQEEIMNEECAYKPRKPVLRKSKRIVRTDSELFDEAHFGTSEEGGVQQTTTRVQIHNEPLVYDEPQSSQPLNVHHDDRMRKENVQKVDVQKESNDLSETSMVRDPLKSTTTNSSRNISVDEADTVFSDSTNDLEKMERDYRELARSNLQREYKSDGDTLDEVGKKRNDFQNWKNQSFETNFESYGQQSSIGGISQSADYMEDPDKIEVLERRESFGAVLSISEDLPNADIDGEVMPNANLSGICSPASHVTCSTTNSSDTSCAKRIKEIANFFAPIGTNYSKDNLSQRESDGSTLTSPLKMVNSSMHPVSPCQRPTKLDILQTETQTTTANTSTTAAVMATVTATAETAAREGTFLSLFEKRFGKLKRINKLLKSKRFSTSALYDKPKEPIKATSIDNPTPSTSQAPSTSLAAVTVTAQAQEKVESASKLFRSRFSPGKSSTSDSKSSVYSSKLSLFSQIANKSSIFHKKSPMFSNSSRSNNELNIRTNSKTRLNEFSKSNSEINRYKTSPMRFSMKRSMKEKKPNSSTCVYTEPCHSPLSEEFYNKTGSVRLSAVELYEKFLSADFVGLYKQEPLTTDDLNGTYDSHYDYRKRYQRSKNARLLKQKSEPKFTFRGDPADYDPREEDEDYYEEEYSGDFSDGYEGEECEYEDEYEMEDMEEMDEMEEMDMEEERDDDQRAYQSDRESDVDEIFLMPEGGKCGDYEYEQYGFENKHFSLEHSMVGHLSVAEHDLSVIDEIPYLDDVVQPEFAYVTEQTHECDEVLTIYKICSADDLLTVKEEPTEEEEEETIQPLSQCLSTSDHTEPGCSSVEHALNEYIKNAPSDISINIESSDLKTDICTVIERADSMESLRLSGSSGTIQSGSTVTGYDFDTVKNLNLDSCSTSKLSLSLKSEGFDEFTLTPDEPKRVRNCDVEDFTLTPEASCNEIVPAVIASSITDEGDGVEHENANIGVTMTEEKPESDLHQIETQRSDRELDGETPQSEIVPSELNAKTDDESISSNEVVMIVDKFLAGERLLQQNLSIIPIDPKTFTSPIISPIDSDDASSTNALIEKQKSILFNLQSSSSKSTLDDAVDLEKINFDEDYDTDAKEKEEISTFTTELTKEFDLLFTRAENEALQKQQQQQQLHQQSSSSISGGGGGGSNIVTPKYDTHFRKMDIKTQITPTNLPMTSSTTKGSQMIGESDSSSTPKSHTPAPTRLPTRYSMQKLEPYFFSDDVTGTNDQNVAKTVNPTKNTDTSSTAPNANVNTSAAVDSKSDNCKVLDTHDNSSFLQKKILSKLKKNKSQSLGNLNKKSRCFPL